MNPQHVDRGIRRQESVWRVCDCFRSLQEGRELAPRRSFCLLVASVHSLFLFVWAHYLPWGCFWWVARCVGTLVLELMCRRFLSSCIVVVGGGCPQLFLLCPELMFALCPWDRTTECASDLVIFLPVLLLLLHSFLYARLRSFFFVSASPRRPFSSSEGRCSFSSACTLLCLASNGDAVAPEIA